MGTPEPASAPANLILSGGIFHPFEATSRLVADMLAEVGIGSDITTDVEGGLARLARPGGYGLVTVNALRWRMLPERYAPYREEWAMSLSPEGRAAVVDHLARGGGILALHTAAICFDDWPGWGEVVGAAWDWDRSCHPPVGPVRVAVRSGAHPIVDGAGDLELVDEIYGFMHYQADLDPLATSAHGGTDHPLLWAREVAGGRVVYDALGHDERSMSHLGHRRIIQRAAQWALGRDTLA